MNFSLSEPLSNYQAATGGFISYIDFHDHQEEDYNGFATALVLRRLRLLPSSPQLDGIRQRALDFLECCASAHIPGAFGFWPPHERPAWACRITEDIDDTAIISLELALYGRRSREQIQNVVYEILIPSLLTDIDPLGPPWIQSLVFPTWLGSESKRHNIVDCCVNTNVVALISWCGLTQLPGYVEACTMIRTGLDWAGVDMQRLRSLTPYYPNPVEFYHALMHAVSLGVMRLQSAVTRLETLFTQYTLPTHLRTVLCSNAYSSPFWRCPALELVRSWTTNFLHEQCSTQGNDPISFTTPISKKAEQWLCHL